MFVPRPIRTQCLFVPLVVCSLVMLCRTSIAPTQTKQRQPAAGHSNIFAVQENCSSSTPAFPPSLTLQPLFLFYQRFGFFLGITPKGQVRGSYKRNNYTKLEMESVGSCLIRIKGIATGKYLAMKNVTSELYTQVQPSMDAVFRVNVAGYFMSLESYQYDFWYVGLRRDGRPRKGKRVHPGRANNKNDGAFAFFIWSPQTKRLKPLSL